MFPNSLSDLTEPHDLKIRLAQSFTNDWGQIQNLPELLDFQIKGVQFGQKRQGRFLIGDEMGLGKTVQALVLAHLNLDWFPILVVCPSVVKYNWQSEIRKHIGRDSYVLDGNNPKLYTPASPFLIINYDIFDSWHNYLKVVHRPKTIIIDECQYLANPETQRTKALMRFCKSHYMPHRIGLSGSPANNRLFELWPILHIIRPSLFPSPEHFFALSADEIHNLLRRVVMIRRRKKQVDLPVPTMKRIVKPVEVSDKQQYQLAEKDFLAWVKRYEPKKPAVGKRHVERVVKIGYLRRLIARLKLPAVIKWLERFLSKTPDEKIIVFAIHKKIIGRLQERFATSCVVIDGSKTALCRRLAVRAFNENPQTRIMLANIDAGGIGWNGTAASTALFIELPWSPSKLAQAEKRIDRIGQTQETKNIYLLAANTIEETIAKILQAKQDKLITCFDGKAIAEEEFKIYDEFLANVKGHEGGFLGWLRDGFFAEFMSKP